MIDRAIERCHEHIRFVLNDMWVEGDLNPDEEVTIEVPHKTEALSCNDGCVDDGARQSNVQRK